MKLFFLCFLMVLTFKAYGNKPTNNLKVFPMTDLKEQISLDFKYTKQEFESISQGFFPNDMDDRWVIIVEGEHIFIYRSWTGTMIFDCLFEERGDEIWVSSMYVNRNIEEYSSTDQESDVQKVKYLLDGLVRDKFNL